MCLAQSLRDVTREYEGVKSGQFDVNWELIKWLCLFLKLFENAMV